MSTLFIKKYKILLFADNKRKKDDHIMNWKFVTFLLIILVLFSQTTIFCENNIEYEELASFSTNFNPGAVNRNYNIKLTAELMNGVILPPGETFSFNETLGPSSQRTGFKLSEIFIRGKKVKGYGGGVCQVSSTLFNAAEQAGLTIVERHSHSKKVDYVEEGRDATTSYGGYDLKFTNNYNFPVLIEAKAEKNIITMTILAVFE